MIEVLLALIAIILAFSVFTLISYSVNKLIHLLQFKKDHTHDEDED